MSAKRRYGEDEVREIFDLVARRDEVQRLSVPDEGGLTLSELQDVGLEAGMGPESVAAAALAIDAQREVLPRGTYLGAPTTVGRIVALPRAPTDHEWEVIVTELRETFGARGEVTSHGGVREWSNGNLHVFVEPTATGYRLRQSTLKGNAAALMTGGAAVAGLGLALIWLFVFEQLGRAALVIPTLMALFGSGLVAANLFRLPRWAREREEQMEQIGGLAVALLGEKPPDDES